MWPSDALFSTPQRASCGPRPARLQPYCQVKAVHDSDYVLSQFLSHSSFVPLWCSRNSSQVTLLTSTLDRQSVLLRHKPQITDSRSRLSDMTDFRSLGALCIWLLLAFTAPARSRRLTAVSKHPTLLPRDTSFRATRFGQTLVYADGKSTLPTRSANIVHALSG